MRLSFPEDTLSPATETRSLFLPAISYTCVLVRWFQETTGAVKPVLVLEKIKRYNKRSRNQCLSQKTKKKVVHIGNYPWAVVGEPDEDNQCAEWAHTKTFMPHKEFQPVGALPQRLTFKTHYALD